MGSVEGEKKALGWAARDPSGVLSPYSYTLRFLIPSSSYIRTFSIFNVIYMVFISQRVIELLFLLLN